MIWEIATLLSKTFLAFREAKVYFGLEGRSSVQHLHTIVIPGGPGPSDALQVHPHVQLIITSWTLTPHLAGYNLTNLTNISTCMKSGKHIFPLDVSFLKIF